MRKPGFYTFCSNLSFRLQFESGDKDGAKSTPTPAIRTEAPGNTEEPDEDPTAEPTEEPTPEPVPTVEPGKETYAEGIKDPDKGIRYTFRPSKGRADHIMINESLATQFFATTTFNKIELECQLHDNIGTIVMELTDGWVHMTHPC